MTIDAERLERLIAALEASANASNRLAQELSDKRRRSKGASAVKLRRAVKRSTKPIELTPLARAQVDRALARAKSAG